MSLSFEKCQNIQLWSFIFRIYFNRTYIYLKYCFSYKQREAKFVIQIKINCYWFSWKQNVCPAKHRYGSNMNSCWHLLQYMAAFWRLDPNGAIYCNSLTSSRPSCASNENHIFVLCCQTLTTHSHALLPAPPYKCSQSSALVASQSRCVTISLHLFSPAYALSLILSRLFAHTNLQMQKKHLAYNYSLSCSLAFDR